MAIRDTHTQLHCPPDDIGGVTAASAERTPPRPDVDEIIYVAFPDRDGCVIVPGDEAPLGAPADEWPLTTERDIDELRTVEKSLAAAWQPSSAGLTVIRRLLHRACGGGKL